MKLEKIMELWEQDSKIDETELGEESLKIPQIHQKYYKFYIAEKYQLKRMESDYKRLHLDKFEFYIQGPNEITEARGWKLPSVGRVLKQDINIYMEADKDIISEVLKITAQKEKVDYLKAIIDSINNRNWNIKAAIDWIKFTHGDM